MTHPVDNIWISRLAEVEIPSVDAALVLAGLRVAVKDNIDVVGFPTTAGCPSFAYEPAASATAVVRLTDVGAVVVGKTNLDQFATGLVGTRSPYGAVRNPFDERYISGGSSSGSAVAVALGLVDIALGTDTAGSGRIPAAFNAIVGLKPTPGLVSTTGVLPACRSLDGVSVFARTVTEAWVAFTHMAGHDPSDPYSVTATLAAAQEPGSLRVGMPSAEALAPFLDPSTCVVFDAAISRLQTLGVSVVPIDLTPFFAAGDLLYGGGLVAERYAAVGSFIEANRGDPNLDPTVAEIILRARDIPAFKLAADLDRLRALQRVVADTWSTFDVFVVPTAPFIPTVDEVQADPIGVNSGLGRFATFANPLGLAALAAPAGLFANGMPFGITLYGPALSDATLARLGAAFLNEESSQAGLTMPSAAAAGIRLAVVGAHLRGQPLNSQLTDRKARFITATTTSADYLLYSLNTDPPEPGLVRTDAASGRAIEVEVWELTDAAFGSFVAAIPRPLAIGKIELADGSVIPGFVCTPDALQDAHDITPHGGWRAYRASLAHSAGKVDGTL
jgi:allophanate hydrolase